MSFIILYYIISCIENYFPWCVGHCSNGSDLKNALRMVRGVHLFWTRREHIQNLFDVFTSKQRYTMIHWIIGWFMGCWWLMDLWWVIIAWPSGVKHALLENTHDLFPSVKHSYWKPPIEVVDFQQLAWTPHRHLEAMTHEKEPTNQLHWRISGWWYTSPPLWKSWSSDQLGWWNSQYIYMENKNHVPNHQPVDVYHCGSISFINPRYAGVYQKQRMVFTCFGPVFQIQTEAQGVDKHIYIYMVYLDPPSTHYQNGMFHDVYPIMLVLLLITSFMGAWRV